MDRTSATSAPPNAAATAARYCRACLYDLSSLTEPRCPECGRDFNPHDARTYVHRSIPAWRRVGIMRWGPRIALALLITSAFVYTVLPRPRRLTDWRLWVWFGQPVGVMYAEGTTHDLYGSIWFGRETRRESFRKSDGALSWRVVHLDEHRYRVDVREPGVRSEWIMAAFNSMKADWFFGVRIERAQKPLSTRPFEIEGDEPAVLGFLAREFEIPLRPFRLTGDQPYVWAYDPSCGEMATIDVTPELADFFPLTPQDPPRTLIPRNERHARIAWVPPPTQHPDQAVE